MNRVVAVVLVVVLGSSVGAQSSLLPTLEALRLAYPAGWTHADRGAYLNAVAFKHKDEGWGLLAKPGGNRCPTPQGVDVSCDYLVYRPTMQGFDVLADETRPTWQAGDVFTSEPERWVAPVSTGSPVPPPIDPLPPPVTAPPLDLHAAILAEVKAARVDIAEFREDVTHRLRDAMEFIGKYIAPALTAFITAWQLKGND